MSPTYAEEICTAQYGEGLEGLFQSNRDKLSGIINGIDRVSFDPETDKAIAANFDGSSLEKKVINKLALQKELGLEEDPDVPLFAMVSRLTTQKGANLIAELLPEFRAFGPVTGASPTVGWMVRRSCPRVSRLLPLLHADLRR